MSETRRRRARLALVLGAVALAAVAILVASAGAAAGAPPAVQDNGSLEPYYGNHSTDINNESWLQGNENATGESIVTMISRVGTFVIGSPSGGGGSGPMLFGVVLLGGLLSLAVSAPVGMIGGGVLFVVALYGIVGVGLVPAWFTAVAMFGVGLLLASAARRVMR